MLRDNNVLQKNADWVQVKSIPRNEYSEQLVPLIYFLFLKLMSFPVRDGIIDLNRIMKYYTFYSKMCFSGIHFCNASLTGNAGWGWRVWKLFFLVCSPLLHALELIPKLLSVPVVMPIRSHGSSTAFYSCCVSVRREWLVFGGASSNQN